MQRIAGLHASLLFTLLIVFAALTIWALLAAWRGREPGSLLLSALTIGELLMVAQAVLGVALMLSGSRPARPELHVIYGVVAVATLPAAQRYARGRPARQQLLVLGLTCLFLCAIILRGVETGRAAPLP